MSVGFESYSMTNKGSIIEMAKAQGWVPLLRGSEPVAGKVVEVARFVHTSVSGFRVDIFTARVVIEIGTGVDVYKYIDTHSDVALKDIDMWRPKGYEPIAPLVGGELIVRDHFAMAALQGLLFNDFQRGKAAVEAYKIADDMLEARK